MESFKKKIAIVTHQMVMGGIEKSLIELCKVLQSHGYDITIFLEKEGGELFDYLPKGLRLVPIFRDYDTTIHIVFRCIRNKEFRKAYMAIKAYLISRCKCNPIKGWQAINSYLDDINEQYDFAFAYGAPISFSTLFVVEKIKARKKYVWIHNEPKNLSLDITQYKKIFKPYDKIVCVSKCVQDTFISIFPEFANKTVVFYNIIDKKSILDKSNEKNTIFFDGVKLLTVGRICFQKGQDILPYIVRKLSDAGYNIKWYCIGDGDLKEKVEELIRQKQIENQLILLGNQKNPYSFFKNMDIYVQPSRHEGFGITITEAKIFNLPIIATDFAGAREQIEDGKTGLIVKFDIDELYLAVKKLIDNIELREEIRKNLSNDKNVCISELEILELK